MTKILLVEDDKSLREIYGVRLLAEGYDIVSAGDGEEALAMAIKEKPSLIVSDVMMPKISGFDMLDILRSTTETRDIKVIMMTALSSEDQRLRGEHLGADRYLVKSQVGIEDVVRTVHEVLGDAPGTAPQATPFGPPAPTAAAPQQAPTPAVQSSSTPQTPAPTPQPVAQPQQPQAPQPPVNPLPQPTAPFSSQRPANLGDRVIHPITVEDANSPQDVASLIEQELSTVNQPSVNQQQEAETTPVQPTAPELPELTAAPQTYSEPPSDSDTIPVEQPVSTLPRPDTQPVHQFAPQPHSEQPDMQEQTAPQLTPPPTRNEEGGMPRLTPPPVPPRPPMPEGLDVPPRQ